MTAQVLEKPKLAGIQSYRDLEVWKRARIIVKQVYQLTQTFPKSEQFGLTMQMHRAAISIPCNIAEEFARHGTKDYINFLAIAIGSTAELETQLILAADLNYADKDKIKPVFKTLEAFHKMLQKMRQNLKAQL